MNSAIVMQTDFTKDTADVCTMHGVCMMVDPTLRIFDNTHSIPSFDTYQASLDLKYVVDFWPEGTVFVSVVDPTVGTSRRACVAKLKNGSYVVTPDNGSLTHLKKYVGIDEVRVIDERVNRLPSTKKVSIFHGRDLFAYCAAKLAAGKITFEEVGESYSVDEIIVHDLVEPYEENDKMFGMISTADDHFGLICSNIPCETFEEKGIKNGDILEVEIWNNKSLIYRGEVPLQPSFGYVNVGEPVIVISETQHMEIAINRGNMTKIYGIGCGPNWLISFKKVEE